MDSTSLANLVLTTFFDILCMSATLALENETYPTHVPEYEAILAPEKHVKYVQWPEQVIVRTIAILNGNR